MMCENCGAEVLEDQEFCQNCGAKISRSFRPLQRRFLHGTYKDQEEDNPTETPSRKKQEKSGVRLGLLILLAVGTLIIGFTAGAIIFSGNGQLIPDMPMFQNQTNQSPISTNDTNIQKTNQSNTNNQTAICENCGGKGLLTCSQCNGQGYISEICSNCGGTGVDPNTGKMCDVCGGIGTTGKAICPSCNGEGTVICWVCGGSGTIKT